MDSITEFPAAKRKMRRDPTLAEKVRILELLHEPKASQSSVARKLGLSQSTVSRVVKKREEILRRWNENENPSRKRNRPYKNARVDEALLHWYLFAKANQMPTSGSILMKRAEVLASEIGCLEFKPSNGWLWRWKERYRLFLRGSAEKTCRFSQQNTHDNLAPSHYLRDIRVSATDSPGVQVESQNVVEERDSTWHLESVDSPLKIEKDIDDKTLEPKPEVQARQHVSAGGPNVFADYSASDVFGATEASLLFRAFPGGAGIDKLQPEMAEVYRERTCIWFCCNMAGTEKLPLLLVSCSSLPRHLERDSSCPISLRSSDNGALDKDLLTEWLLDWDGKLVKEKRNILLALNVESSLPKVKLRNITLHCLPVDKTGPQHPFGQEVVNEFKAFYRHFFLERLLDGNILQYASEQSCLKLACRITLLDASYIMNEAWRNVTNNTIQYCFQRSGLKCVGNNPTLLCSIKVEPPAGMSTEQFNAYTLLEDSETFLNHPSILSHLQLDGRVGKHDSLVQKERQKDKDKLGSVTESANSYSEMKKIKLECVSDEENPDVIAGKGREDDDKTSEFICTGTPGKQRTNESVPIEDVKVAADVWAETNKGQELRAACNIIRHHLAKEKQDMSVFYMLEHQLETLISQKSKESES